MDGPNMSDTTVLVSVEDLICMAMGPPDKNVVNYKLIQTVLHILARQMRMLTTQVEIRLPEPAPEKKSKKRTEKKKVSSEEESDAESAKEDVVTKKPKTEKGPDKEKAAKKTAKEQERLDKEALKEKEKMAKMDKKEREKYEKEKEKAEKEAQKEKEKLGKMDAKEKDKYEKEKAKAEKEAQKEKEKLAKMDAKEREKYEKEQAKAEKEAQKEKEKLSKMDAKEREKYEKEQAKAEKEAQKEKEKLSKMDAKEREKYEKEQAKAEKEAQKEKEKLAKMDAKEKERYEKEKAKSGKEAEKDRERAEKEKEKLAKMDAKEREKYEKEHAKSEKEAQKEKERAEKEKEKLAKMDAKEREKYEKEQAKAEKEAKKEKERAEKEKEKLAKMDAKEREKYEKEQAKAEKEAQKERERVEKEKEKLAKMDAKEKEKYEKELAKAEKEAQKERERVEKEKEKLAKMDAKEREKYEKEQAKAQKEAQKERERAEKEAKKEEELLAKMDKKEREKYEKEKLGKYKERKRSAISVTESLRDDKKVLVVEKGPTTQVSKARVGSIEVVTVSQFELLQGVVEELAKKAGPLPLPSLPSNRELMSQLAKGSASLTDTMEAMQVSARMQAAEEAISRMADLLQQMAAVGALPAEFADKLETVASDLEQTGVKHVKLVEDYDARKVSRVGGLEAKPVSSSKSITARPSMVAASTGQGLAAISKKSSVFIAPKVVTHPELNDAVHNLKEALLKNMNNISAKASAAAESANAAVKSITEKLDVAVKISSQIASLNSIVSDYAQQLEGFDAGLTTQMQNFQEQMAQMRSDLKGGLAQLEAANNNAESAALVELMDRYNGLMMDLEHTTGKHQDLTAYQRQLSDDLSFLVQNVEMLREQKADRDEMLDGLRDKADNSRLAGLLTETAFDSCRNSLELRLDACHDKFRKQENVWLRAVKDLYEVAGKKADMMPLLAMREDSQRELQEIKDWLELLTRILGEPKAAVLTRALSRNGTCASCAVPALMEATEPSAGRPPALPALRPPPIGEEPCVPLHQPVTAPPDTKIHKCQRYVGGSHTMLSTSTVREQATPMLGLGLATKKYTGYGTDGRLYKMEDELEPCIECNWMSTDREDQPEGEASEKGKALETKESGAGDQGDQAIKQELN